MKLESLEDLLEINTDTMKSPDKSRLLTRIKQIIKAEKKSEANADEKAKGFPYEGLSLVGSKYVEIKFDLESKEARVMDVSEDPRDTRGKNYMAGAKALRRIQELSKLQKEL